MTSRLFQVPRFSSHRYSASPLPLYSSPGLSPRVLFAPPPVLHQRTGCLLNILWIGTYLLTFRLRINPPHIVAHTVCQPLLRMAVKAILPGRLVWDKLRIIHWGLHIKIIKIQKAKNKVDR